MCMQLQKHAMHRTAAPGTGRIWTQWATMDESAPVKDQEVGTPMTPVRRIAAAALVAALGLGFVGATSAPAGALDITWGRHASR